MAEKPDYVLNFPRQKNTEIKKIGNNWYLYCWGPSKKKHFGQANLKRGQVN